jgi:hypothetical protein
MNKTVDSTEGHAFASFSGLLGMLFQVMPRLRGPDNSSSLGKAIGTVRHDNGGLLKTPHLRRSQYVEQLNAAGREVAHGELGMCLLDAALMTAGLNEEQRLSDDSHPSEMVWEEMMNLLLNIAEEERSLAPNINHDSSSVNDLV